MTLMNDCSKKNVDAAGHAILEFKGLNSNFWQNIENLKIVVD